MPDRETRHDRDGQRRARGDLVAALYSGRDQVEVDAVVTFEDGREGHVAARLAFTDLAPHAVLDHAA